MVNIMKGYKMKHGMKYEETPQKKPKLNATKLALKEVDYINTRSIVWYLVKRHRFSLVSTWAVTITIFYMAPFVPDLIVNSLR